mmetsp:Transcript_32270/g.81503  ORF Transcript_32270/g.81503 Transcript_32270/m.81503 type:complete len:238 (-) Transcript_32270:415-1128(-)
MAVVSRFFLRNLDCGAAVAGRGCGCGCGGAAAAAADAGGCGRGCDGAADAAAAGSGGGRGGAAGGSGGGRGAAGAAGDSQAAILHTARVRVRRVGSQIKPQRASKIATSLHLDAKHVRGDIAILFLQTRLPFIQNGHFPGVGNGLLSISHNRSGRCPSFSANVELAILLLVSPRCLARLQPPAGHEPFLYCRDPWDRLPGRARDTESGDRGVRAAATNMAWRLLAVDAFIALLPAHI